MTPRLLDTEKVGEAVLDQGTVAFQAEGRLLQELGERLVASPEVALVELIKNAFDADSPICEVRLEKDGRALFVIDQGHGMTKDEFVGKWMNIATASKVAQRFSRVYERHADRRKGNRALCCSLPRRAFDLGEYCGRSQMGLQN